MNKGLKWAGAAAAGALGWWAAVAGPANAASDCKLKQIVQLPVTMVAGRPTVPVQINGIDGQFVVASGAFFSVINPAATTRFGLHPGFEPNLRVKGIGGETNTQSAHVDTFTLGGLPFRNVDFLVLPGAGSGIAGALGQNFLGGVDIEYDLANGAVRLFRSDGCGSDNLAYWATTGISTLSITPNDSPQDRHIRTYGSLNGQRITLQFDTGSARSILTLHAAARAGVTPKTPGAVYGGQEGGVGPKKIDTWVTPFDSFKLGAEEVQHTRLRIGDIVEPDDDMLVGADFFLSHRVYISNTQHKIYFTYNGGPVFDLIPPKAAQTPATDLPAPAPAQAPPDMQAATTATEPTDAPTDEAGFLRRADAFMARFDYAHAIEDFTRANALNPTDPLPLLQRARARVANRQLVLAMSDLDQALKLKPDDRAVLALRAGLYNGSGDKAHAREDLDALARATPPEPGPRLVLANTYRELGFLDEALRQYDQWIADNPKNPDLHIALERRCFARTMAKVDLDKALADCDAALKLMPKAPNALRSRGLLHFERGEFDAAIADDDALLRQVPKDALTLYERGVAKQRKGLAEDGAVDIASATAITPQVAVAAKGIGLTP